MSKLQDYSDELPFWPALFGLKLLDLVSCKERINVYSGLYENR